MSTRDMGLASLVALPNPDSWGDACPAWIESADRKCGKPRTEGLLCKRHHTVALRRLAAMAEKERGQAARAAEKRERDLPKWRAELARVEARMRVLDPPMATTDRAAYGGILHSSIQRERARRWSDSRVQEMAQLVTRAERLRSWIGAEA